MKREFIVERQGKAFVLYAGLLDLAHQKGLASLMTEIVQIPMADNGSVAIMKATATFEVEGSVRVFTAFGDAALNNVAPAMQTCLLRMAETRAKARALRDAVNIGVTAFEEIGDGEDHEEPQPRIPSVRPASPRTGEKPSEPVGPGLPMLAAQKDAINKLCERHKKDAQALAEERFGIALTAITQSQAAELIKSFSVRRAA